MIYFIISGLLRSFTTVLYPYLIALSEYADIRIVIGVVKNIIQSDINYLKVHSHDNVQIVQFDDLDLSNLIDYSQREKNIIHQWYNLYSTFIAITDANNNDIFIRLRPDIQIFEQPKRFLEIINSCSNSILIPNRSDIFDKSFSQYLEPNSSINDQIAIAKYKYFKNYANLYPFIDYKVIDRPIISEALLFKHIYTNLSVSRIDIKYNLTISRCKIISIAGDSGVGKSTLVNAISKFFPMESTLIFETDRYHKWNRYNLNWQVYTHLNPNANNIEKMFEDAHILKTGESIYQIDYDHSTGFFTDLQRIESKKNIFLCGLHTMYDDRLRSISDIKIYINMEESLKREWKITRDILKRGYTYEHAEKIYNNRKKDYELFIHPQIQYADIIIYYYKEQKKVCCKLTINKQFSKYIENSIHECVQTRIESENTIEYILKDIIKDDLIKCVPRHLVKYFQYNNLDASYTGILQIFITSLLLEGI